MKVRIKRNDVDLPITKNHKKFVRKSAKLMDIQLLHNIHNAILEKDMDALNIYKDDIEKILHEYKASKTCPKCGKTMYLSDLPQYDYVCVNCDENFY